MASSVPLRSTIPRASADPETSAPIWARSEAYQSGEVDEVGGISKRGDRRVRTCLCEAAIVMLMRCKGQLKPKPSLFTKQEAEF